MEKKNQSRIHHYLSFQHLLMHFKNVFSHSKSLLLEFFKHILSCGGNSIIKIDYSVSKNNFQMLISKTVNWNKNIYLNTAKWLNINCKLLKRHKNGFNFAKHLLIVVNVQWGLFFNSHFILKKSFSHNKRLFSLALVLASEDFLTWNANKNSFHLKHEARLI